MQIIQLTQNQVALVDDEDFEKVNFLKWCVGKRRDTFYAYKRFTKGLDKSVLVPMQNFILDLPLDRVIMVDHIDGNGLNNQKLNLRVCNNQQNNMNKGLQKNVTSGYKGVCYDKNRNKWAAYISLNGKHMYLGRFDFKEEAAYAYDQAANSLYGSFAKTNIDIMIKILCDSVILPQKVYNGDAGWDLFSTLDDFLLGPFERIKIPLGFALEIPPNWVAIIQEKSGLANKHGIITIGNVIDSNYRGEVHATLYNGSLTAVKIIKGNKIAQMIIHPCNTGIDYKVVDKLSDSQRGTGGFGSTGVKRKENA